MAPHSQAPHPHHKETSMLTRARRALILAGATALLALGAVTPAAAQKQTVVIYTAIENEQTEEAGR